MLERLQRGCLRIQSESNITMSPELETDIVGDAFTARLTAERSRLVRLCAHLTGDAGVAEDLAQETLAEAWRRLSQLREPEGMAPWLSAIARNFCLRWTRQRGRDLAHTARPGPLDDDHGDAVAALVSLPADGDDLSITLERAELVNLLDHALALLSPDARAALVGTYVRELPQAELAARLGVSQGTLRVRLHRGRLALRHLLASDLRDEADAMGLALPVDDGTTPAWRQTRIWCPFCGRHPLEYQLDRASKSYTYRCVGLCADDGIIAGSILPSAAWPSSPKPALTRLCLVLDTRYRDILAEDYGRCDLCGAPLTVLRRSPQQPLDALLPSHGIELVCPTCGSVDGASAWHLALDTAEAQRFWQRHPRMRALRVREVEAEGRPALITGFESVDTTARVVLTVDTRSYRVLRVRREGD